MTLDEKLDQFYKATIDSATSQKVASLEEYEKSLLKILEDHKEEALRKAELSYQVEHKRLISEKNRDLSNESIKAKRILSEKSEEITDKLFEEVQQRLVDYMKTPAYTSLLISQIIKAKDFANDCDVTIYINPTDAALKNELEAATGTTLTVSETDFFGGSRAVIRSRNILIDHSFVTKLKEAKEAFQL